MKNERFKNAINLQNPSSNDRERIFEELTKKVPAQKRFKYNMYGIKRVSVMLAALCIVILVSNITIYAISNKSILDFFFSKKDALKIEDLMYKDGQQVVIDDYTITLDSVVYEHNTSQGYLLFAVERDGYNMKDEYTRRLDVGIGFAFGEDGRFEFFFADYGVTPGSMSVQSAFVDVEKHKDVMYIYYNFSIKTDKDPFNDIIYLYDKQSGKENEYGADRASGSFRLRDQVKSKTYSIVIDGKEYDIIISPFYFRIDVIGRLNEIGDTCIFYKDGSKLPIMQDNAIVCYTYDDLESYDHNTEEYRFGLKLKDIVDVENIDYIEYDGNKVFEK